METFHGTHHSEVWQKHPQQSIPKEGPGGIKLHQVNINDLPKANYKNDFNYGGTNT